MFTPPPILPPHFSEGPSMSQQVTRRQFIATAASAAGAAAAGSVFAAPAVLSEKSPNSKLGTVVIGVVNQGKPAVVAACTQRLVALCDVDDSHNAQAKKFIAQAAPRDQSLRRPGVLRLPPDVRQDPQGHRRGVHCRPGPSPRRGVADRHAAGQARLLRETDGPQHRRGAADDGNGPQVQGRDATGQSPSQFGKRPPLVRVHLGRGHRQRDGDL